MVKGKRAEHELTSHSLTLAFHDRTDACALHHGIYLWKDYGCFCTSCNGPASGPGSCYKVKRKKHLRCTIPGATKSRATVCEHIPTAKPYMRAAT